LSGCAGRKDGRKNGRVQDESHGVLLVGGRCLLLLVDGFCDEVCGLRSIDSCKFLFPFLNLARSKQK
jgi:hypothetical protein